jgi:aldose 1-epimerase
MAEPISPSGEQIELSAGDQHAVVTEVGAGLRSYAAGERQLLDGYGLGELCPSGRGQLLLPWPNRIEDGTYEHGGRRHQLPLTEPERGNAIHGLVRWAAWRIREREPHRAVLAHVLHPQPGYPFSLALTVEYALSPEGLEVRTTAANVGTEPCPYGVGAHPYLTVGTPTVDRAILRVPASTVLVADERGIPTGARSVAETAFDFRRPRAIGELVLDHAFTGLERDADGRARVELRHPDEGTSLTLWVDEAYRYLMLFTGDPLPDVRRRSLAVEPMTCPPNAFRSGEGVVVLAPGASATAAWGLAPSSSA